MKCDLLVLGGGPGGYTAAFRAADLGQRVVLVERYPALGGVCLNVGCIPSKALLHTAEAIEEARACSRRGVEFGEPTIDLDKLRGWKDGVVRRLTGGLDKMAELRRIERVVGRGHFASPSSLTVEGDEGETSIEFSRAILAVGSRPIALPGAPEDPRIFGSTGALELRSIPARLLVIGGGVIGLELGTAYQALGSRVTVVEALDGILLPLDRDLVRPLERRLRRQGQTILTGTRVISIRPATEEITVELEAKDGRRTDGFDAVLVAIGRRANGDQIRAEAAGVAVDDRGVIAVDTELRTNMPHIFAIGDVTGGPQLAHRATHQGKIAAEVAAGLASAFDPLAVPSVAYTSPEIAWVGLNEGEARKQSIPYEAAVFPWTASGRALGMEETDGLTKLLFDPVSRKLLGGAIVGARAGDLISELALGLEMGSDATDLGLTIHPHPTLSETISMAAELFEGTITDLYLPKKKARRDND